MESASAFPKILYVSRSVPPIPTGSATISANFAQAFSQDEMVVVGAKGQGRVEWPADGPALRYASWHPPESLRGKRWIRWAQFPLVLARLLYLCLAHRCQVIFATFPDEIYLLAAYLVSVILRKPLFAYFHNTYLENRPGLTAWNGLACWLQPRVFRRARHIFVMSAGMQQLYQARYPGLAVSPLVHTFNEPIPESVAHPAPGSPLVLTMIGNVTASCADAVRRLGQVFNDLPDSQWRIYSGEPRAYERLGFVGERVQIKRVSRQELLSSLRAADIVLLPHGLTGNTAQEEIQTIFPTKTIECLLSTRPILAHVPEGCFLTEFLRQHDCALIVSAPDPEALKAAIQQIAADPALREKLVTQALKTARQFYAPAVAQQVRRMIQATQS